MSKEMEVLKEKCQVNKYDYTLINNLVARGIDLTEAEWDLVEISRREQEFCPPELISALLELQAYRDKDVAKKVVITDEDTLTRHFKIVRCPICNDHQTYFNIEGNFFDTEPKYCSNCGQKLYWSK
jgi:ribosomal protein S27E